MSNIYGIYSKFNDFLGLEDRPTSQVQQQINNVGEKVREYKEMIFSKKEDDKQGNAQKRSNSFWGRIEQKFHNQQSKSPIPQAQERKKIFADAPSIPRTKPMIFGQPSWGQTSMKLQQPLKIESERAIKTETFLDESNLTINESFRVLLEDITIDDMYFKQENESEILSNLIMLMGRKPSLEKQGFIFENLSRKNSETKKQLSLKLLENQHQLHQGFQLHDSLTYRVSQCCSRVGRARIVLKLLRETHRDLGLRIQKKQQKKAELEQQLANVVKFRSKYQQVFELVSELSREKLFPEESWPLYKVTTMKDQIWTQTRDSKEQMHLYLCFNDLRGFIENLFQQQLELSYRFFTQNIVSAFVTNNDNREQLFRTVANMCDYLQQYELNNKSVDISKQIRISLQGQFRSILRLHIEKGALPKNYKLLKRGIKYDCLHSLNIYLSAFLQSFYLTSYALGLIVQQFQKLLQTTKQTLLKKVGFQYNIEKNQFWQYVQDKLVKSIRHTKLEAGCAYPDWIKFEATIIRIIQIGEELSNLKSDTILLHLNNSLRFIAQGISSALMQCLSVQKGMGTANPVKPQYACILLNRLDILQKTRRFNSPSQYLTKLIDSKDLLPVFDQSSCSQPIESLYNKKEEYFFVVSQLQELLLFAENIPSHRIDCLLHTIHCFEYYCYLLIKCDLQTQIKQLLDELSDFEHQNSKYCDLQQMLAKQTDSIRSSGIQIQVVYQSTCLREIVENVALVYQIYDFIYKSYSYKEDSDFIEQNMRKTRSWLDQLKHFWIYVQSQKDITLEQRQITSYQIMYKMTQIFHQISVQTMNNRVIKTEDVERIYFHSYIEQIINLSKEIISRQNKLYIEAELQKFQKQLGEQYKSQELEQYILDLKI